MTSECVDAAGNIHTHAIFRRPIVKRCDAGYGFRSPLVIRLAPLLYLFRRSSLYGIENWILDSPGPCPLLLLLDIHNLPRNSEVLALLQRPLDNVWLQRVVEMEFVFRDLRSLGVGERLAGLEGLDEGCADATDGVA